MFPFKKKRDPLDLTKNEPLLKDEPSTFLHEEKTSSDENISTKLELIISQLKNIESRLENIEIKLSQQPQEKSEALKW